MYCVIKEFSPCEYEQFNTYAGQEILFFSTFIYIAFSKPGLTFHALVVLKLFIAQFSLSLGNMLRIPVTYLCSRTCVLDLSKFFFRG